MERGSEPREVGYRTGEPREITYRNKGIAPGRGNAYIVQEYYGRNAVNEYTGYDNGGHFTLYPRRRLYPSPVEITKKNVSIRDIKRDF